ncbi:hypothetical protein T484DRAFT_1761490 [Baffinella frigidus]|nr:hypothetical protein T484DRAFT_1761490 [Cryptophyta sp. CCMP2293]
MDFICRAAVPKYIAVEMGQPSGTHLAANEQGTIASCINLSNPLAPDKPLKLQLRTLQ